MKVKLYENCILNQNYKDVFRTQEILNNYLATLKNTEIELNDNYFKLSGSILFEMINNLSLINFNLWNYISFEKSQNNYIYGFIDKVEIYNGVIQVYYTCDIWHSYIDTFEIKNGILSNTRYIPFENDEPIFYDYPFDFMTNKPLKIDKEFNDENNLSLILELQAYRLSDVGAVFSPITYSGVIQYNNKINFNSSELGVVLDAIAVTQAGKQNDNDDKIYPQFAQYAGQDKGFWLYYKVVNTYIVPYSFLTAKDGETIYIDKNDYTPIIHSAKSGVTELYLLKPKEVVNKVIKSYIIEPDKKIRGYGFYNNQFKYAFTGKKKYIDIMCHFDTYDFKIYFNDNNGIKDITAFFEGKLNFEPQDAQSLEQQKISKNLQILSLQQQRNSEILGTVGGVVNMGVGVAGIVASEGASVASYAQVAGGVTQTISGITGIVNTSSKIAQIQSQQYNNAFATNNSGVAKINALYGFCIFSIDVDNIINNSLVENAINEQGYNVNYYINTLDVVENIKDYNIVKFDFLRVIGLPSEYNSAIEKILMNGVKLHYDKI